jgi:hypothetical protein
MAAKQQEPSGFVRLIACATKCGFDSKALAEKVAHRSRTHRHYRVAVYHCRTCGKWHIGGGVKRRRMGGKA